MGNFQLNGKRLMWFQYTKKEINKTWKTTFQYLCFLSLEKYLKEYCKINYEFFTENNLISPNQSGFKPGDSCVNQILSITHEIYKSFDDGLEVRGTFLDISKAFDKVRRSSCTN